MTGLMQNREKLELSPNLYRFGYDMAAFEKIGEYIWRNLESGNIDLAMTRRECLTRSLMRFAKDISNGELPNHYANFLTVLVDKATEIDQIGGMEE